MSKEKTERALKDNEAKASPGCCGEPAKAEPFGAAHPWQEGRDGFGRSRILAQRVAFDVKKALESAIANAETTIALMSTISSWPRPLSARRW